MARKLTRKSASKWLKQEKVSTHEAVSLLLGIEPHGERPANPSAEYLQAEQWLRDKVPLASGEPYLIAQARHCLKNLYGRQDGVELEAALKDFAAMPKSEQEFALGSMYLAQAQTAAELHQILNSEPLRSLPEQTRTDLLARLLPTLPH